MSAEEAVTDRADLHLSCARRKAIFTESRTKITASIGKPLAVATGSSRCPVIVRWRFLDANNRDDHPGFVFRTSLGRFAHGIADRYTIRADFNDDDDQDGRVFSCSWRSTSSITPTKRRRAALMEKRSHTNPYKIHRRYRK